MGLFDNLIPVITGEELKSKQCLSCNSEYDKETIRQKIPTIQGRAIGPCCQKCWNNSDNMERLDIIQKLEDFWKEIDVLDEKAIEYLTIARNHVKNNSWDKEKQLVIQLSDQKMDIFLEKFGDDEKMRPMEGLNLLLDVIAFKDDNSEWLMN